MPMSPEASARVKKRSLATTNAPKRSPAGSPKRSPFRDRVPPRTLSRPFTKICFERRFNISTWSSVVGREYGVARRWPSPYSRVSRSWLVERAVGRLARDEGEAFPPELQRLQVDAYA